MKVKGTVIFRTLFFMPSCAPGSAVVLWLWLLNPTGRYQHDTEKHGDQRSCCLPTAVGAPSLVMVGCGGIGGTRMIIFLAGYKGSREMYDARPSMAPARGAYSQHYHPLLSPTIFFNLVLAIIGALQSFQGAFVARRRSGIRDMVLWAAHLQTCFDYWNMGYASALAWFFAVVIIGITIAQQRLSSKWSFTTEPKEQRWPP